MGKICIFCGAEPGLLQRKSLWCGGTSQCVCSDCYQKYAPWDAAARAELALETGRAERPQELREYVERMQEARKQQEAEETEKRQARMTKKRCLRCGGPMAKYGPLMLKLGEETFFMSDLHRIMAGSLEVEILRCEECGKAEFYIPDPEKGLKED